MDEDRPDVPLLPQFLELGDIVLIKRLDSPAAGIPAEYLHAGAAEFEGTLHGERETARDGHMEADSHKNPCLPSLPHHLVEFLFIDDFHPELFAFSSLLPASSPART